MGIFDQIGSGFLNAIGTIIDKFNLSPEEKLKAQQELTDAANRHIEAMATLQQTELANRLRDVQSARDMFKDNSSLQKVYALTFLASYMALVFALLMILVKHLSMAPEAIALISTIFGAMTGKIGSITDFLFGSSHSSQVKDDTIQTIVKNGH